MVVGIGVWLTSACVGSPSALPGGVAITATLPGVTAPPVPVSSAIPIIVEGTKTARPTTRAIQNVDPTSRPTAVPPTDAPWDEFHSPEVQADLDWLIESWKTGEDLDAVRTMLEERGILASDLLSQFEGLTRGNTFAASDLSGDGKDEWIVSIGLRQGGCSSLATDRDSGDLLIIGEGGLLFHLYATEAAEYWETPLVVAVADATGDGLPDLITRVATCGAHTVTGVYHILSWVNGEGIRSVGQKENILDQAANEVSPEYDYSQVWSSPAIAITTPSDEVRDATGDGVADLILRGGTYGSMGAGLIQYRTEVWSWDGVGVSLQSIGWEPSNSRVHRLFQANFHRELGEYAQAQREYIQAITDSTLDNNMGYGTEEEILQSVQTFSAFRLMLLGLQTKDVDLAEEWNTWLVSHYPEDPITREARHLLDQWPESDPVKLCALITEAFDTGSSQHEPVTGALSDVGYGNPSLRNSDLCRLAR